MKIASIKAHLKAYSIFQKRKTTIHHAFASAVAPNDPYNEDVVKEAVAFLGQDPAGELSCAYCGKKAETWDHVYSLVRDGEFSGYGHVVGNLLPCCKGCNSAKGNKDWEEFLESKGADFMARKDLIRRYVEKYLIGISGRGQICRICEPEIKQLDGIRDEIISLFRKADVVAKTIREKISSSARAEASL